MKISLNWLKDYVMPGVSTGTLAHKLTMAGLEVEKTFSDKGDTMFELEITPNRPDCLSMLGIARETAAILNKPRTFPKIKKRAWPKAKCDIEISDRKGCQRYIGTLIEDVTVKKSQGKIIKRLEALGIRAVNNVVDITNFCLMETGQPLHAFDYDKLAGGKIIVRRARKDEKIITIDNVERTLDPSILVIADEKRPVAIAGIMGGKETEVTRRTKNILLESAYFDPILIRRASRKLGLSSDSAYRFERGVDREMVKDGSMRAIDLILKDANGSITRRADIGGAKGQITKKAITISTKYFNERVGASLTSAQFKNILTRMDFQVQKNKAGAFQITPPSFRSDVRENVDVMEEVARMIGYDNLPLTLPHLRITQGSSDPKISVRRSLKVACTAQGFNEVITYTMINDQDLQRSGQGDLPKVTVLNPLTRDQEVMRPALLPNFLSIARSNINRGQKNIKFFEVGKVYEAKGEKDVVALLITGRPDNDWRQAQKRKSDFYDLKGSLERIFDRLGIKGAKIRFYPVQKKYLEQGQCASVFIESVEVGIIGKVHEEVLSAWDIRQEDVYFAQVDLGILFRNDQGGGKYKPIPEFPAICRDISLAVRDDKTAHDVERSIRETVQAQDKIILADLKFIEKYEGDKIPEGCTGLIYSLTYRARTAKTLRDEEVSQVHEKVCDVLVNDLGAIQR